MFRGNLPRCHLVAISRRVGLFWPIIVAKSHFSGVNGAGFRLNHVLHSSIGRTYGAGLVLG